MIYIHVPFCKSFCAYCDFYSLKCSSSSEGDVNAYVEALLHEISHRKPYPGGPDTLYMGGGTPSVMNLDFFEKVTEALKPFGPFEEFTVEVNPDDVIRKGVSFFKALKSLGVNRISMGVQSLDDAVLRWMRRRHSADDAVKAFDILRQAGFDNISLDLITCLNTDKIPNSRQDSVFESLKGLIALHPEHISAYSLTLENGTLLDNHVRNGLYSQPSQEECLAETMAVNRILSRAGYQHYEISNYALAGRRAVHNSAYWNHSPYIGYGPAAHSFDGSVREWNAASLKKYLSGKGRGTETLTADQLRLEEIMLSLRTSDGLDVSKLSSKHLNMAISKGYLEKIPGNDHVRIPEDRWIISDYIIAELVSEI